MGASFAVGLGTVLGTALRDVQALGMPDGGDPLRLQLPPDSVVDDTLEPASAAVLGSLYLLSELEQCGVVACADLLADQRWELGIPDAATNQKLEAYAGNGQRWPRVALRQQLYARLFGSADTDAGATTNQVFEELLAGYCDAIASFDPRALPRNRTGLRLAGDRLRANLAPRQYGNTLIVAKSLVQQVSAALDLLAREGIGRLFHVTGAWDVVRAMQPDSGIDIGRHVDRGQAGRTLIASVGYPTVPDLVDSALSRAADAWLVATGFESQPVVGGPR
jgi:hypothetical protein